VELGGGGGAAVSTGAAAAVGVGCDGTPADVGCDGGWASFFFPQSARSIPVAMIEKAIIHLFVIL